MCPQSLHAPEARAAIREWQRKAEEERAQQEERAHRQKREEAERQRREREAVSPPLRQAPAPESGRRDKRKWLPIAIGVLVGVMVWGILEIVNRDNVSLADEPAQERVEDTTKQAATPVTTPSTVRLNGKTWMAENLNYEVSGSWCYDNKPGNCDKYGRLYTWEAAKKACAAVGWRLPTDEEWKSLANAYGGYYDWQASKDVGNPKQAYSALIKEGSTGFAALLGGSRYSNGEYFYLGRNGYYWSATGSGADNAWYYDFYGDDRRVGRFSSARSLGFSCRCLKGAPSNGID